MDIRKLQRAIVDGLEDVKAHNIVVFNTEHLSPLFERVIIASGTSNRQTKALASSVRETVKERGMQVLATEGADNGEWIIVDCGAAVAHIMQPAIRDYYHLEELWGEKPVRMKIAAGGARLLPKAAEDDAAPSASRKSGARRATRQAPEPAPARTRAPAAKQVGVLASRAAAGPGGGSRPAAAGKPKAGKPVASKRAAPQTSKPKASATKSPAHKTATSKVGAGKAPPRTAVRTLVVHKSPAGKSPARKTAPRKTAAGKTAAGKTAPRKSAAPRSAPRKTTAPRKTAARKTAAGAAPRRR